MTKVAIADLVKERNAHTAKIIDSENESEEEELKKRLREKLKKQTDTTTLITWLQF